jgi:hypothetical protein
VNEFQRRAHWWLSSTAKDKMLKLLSASIVINPPTCLSGVRIIRNGVFSIADIETDSNIEVLMDFLLEKGLLTPNDEIENKNESWQDMRLRTIVFASERTKPWMVISHYDRY